MYYVSRLFGGESDRDRRVGVVSIDTQEESIITCNELSKLVLDHKETVLGAAPVFGLGSNVIPIPYQDEQYLTSRQSKLKVFKRINVVTWKDIITRIEWSCMDIMNNVTIRLSDFGHEIADLAVNPYVPLEKKDVCIRFVLDDKVKVNRNSFNAFIGSSTGQPYFILDLHEVTDPVLALDIYHKILDWHHAGDDCYLSNAWLYIDDDYDRLMFYMGLYTKCAEFRYKHLGTPQYRRRSWRVSLYCILKMNKTYRGKIKNVVRK